MKPSSSLSDFFPFGSFAARSLPSPACRHLAWTLALWVLIAGSALGQTILTNITFVGTFNRVDNNAELTIASGGILTGASGSVIDLYHATVSLPDALTLTDLNLTGTNTQLLDTATFTLKSGSTFTASSGSTLDLAAATIAFPTTVVLTTGTQTLTGKTLVSPIISTVTSALNMDLTLNVGNNGANIRLGQGPDGTLTFATPGAGYINQLFTETPNNIFPSFQRIWTLDLSSTGYGDFGIWYNHNDNDASSRPNRIFSVGYNAFQTRANENAFAWSVESYYNPSGSSVMESYWAYTRPDGISYRPIFWQGDRTTHQMKLEFLSSEYDFNMQNGVERYTIDNNGFSLPGGTLFSAGGSAGNVRSGGNIISSTYFGNNDKALVGAGFYGTFPGSSSNQTQFLDAVTIASSNTDFYTSFDSNPKTTTASFTLGMLNGFLARNSDKGSNSHVTFQHGFHVLDLSMGETLIAGFRGEVSSGTNKWNLYLDGSASNYLRGNVLIGGTTDITGSGGLKVFGTTDNSANNVATGALQVLGGASIAKSLNVLGGRAASSTTSGDLVVAGGTGIGGSLYVGGRLSLLGGTTGGLWLDSAQAWYASGANQLTYDQGGTGDASISIRGGVNSTLGIKAGSTSGGMQGGFLTWNDTPGGELLQLGVGATEVARASGTTLGTGSLKVNYTTASTSSTSGAFQVMGGAGVGGALYVGGSGNFAGSVSITSAASSSSPFTGALVVAGGFGLIGNQYLGGSLNLPGGGNFSGASGSLSLAAGGANQSITLAASGTGAVTVASTLNANGALNANSFVAVNSTTDSTSTATGALVVNGGAAIQKRLTLGGDVVLVPSAASAATTRLSGTAVTDTPGIWFKDGGSPTAANAALAGNATTTILNGPIGGTVSLRVDNSPVVTVGATAVTQNVPLNVASTAASLSVTTGSATFGGGIGVNGRASLKSLSVGGGSAIDLVQTVVTSLDFPSIAANGGVQDLAVALAGASLGDSVNIVETNGVFTAAGLQIRAIVTAANTITVRATNLTASAIDPSATTYRVTLISF